MKTGLSEYSEILNRLVLGLRNQLAEKAFGFAGAAPFQQLAHVRELFIRRGPCRILRPNIGGGQQSHGYVHSEHMRTTTAVAILRRCADKSPWPGDSDPARRRGRA